MVRLRRGLSCGAFTPQNSSRPVALIPRSHPATKTLPPRMPRLLLAALIGMLAVAPPAMANAADGTGATRRTNRFLDYTSAVRSEILVPTSCPFDPTAIVQLVGADPEKLAAYVRDKIRYEPYLGIVRGPGGTLAAGSGGDWDRAALLRALLTQAGIDSSLLVLRRSPAQADAAVAAFLAARPRAKSLWDLPDVDPARLPPANPFLARFHIPAGNRLVYLRRSLADWRSMVDECLAAASVEQPVLDSSLAASGHPAMGAPFDQWQASLLAGAAERVMVTVTTPSGQRVLPVGPDSGIPAESDLNAAVALSDVPADRNATLTLRLSMTVSGGEADADPMLLLESSLPLGELFRTPTRLEIIPYDPKAANGPPLHWAQDKWFDNISGFKQFLAVLRSGSEETTSKLFDLNGQLHEIADDGQVSDAQNLGGGMVSGFGGALGGDNPSAPVGTHLKALILDIELALPGQPPAKSRRLLFGQERPGGSPIVSFDVLALGGPLGPSTVDWIALDALTADAPMIAAAYGTHGPTDADPAKAVGTEDRIRIPSLLYQWQTGRVILAAEILTRHPNLAVLNGPAIVLQGERLTIDAGARRIGGHTAIDVVFDGQRIVPRIAPAVKEAAEANETLGVASTVLESVLLGRAHPTEDVRGPYAASEEAALSGQTSVVRLSGGTGKESPLAEWAVCNNEPGRLMVFPVSQSATTWWAIDPATGATIGRGDDGEGQSTIEYLKVTKENLANLKCCLGFLSGFMNGNKGAAYDYVMCITSLDNPGEIVAGGAGFLGTMTEDFEASGEAFGLLGDALAGALDLKEAMGEGEGGGGGGGGGE